MEALDFDPGTVAVWKVDLSPLGKLVEKCLAVLTDDERQRAGRFLTEQLRHRFILSRGQLRMVLARYLSVPPRSVEFELGEYGKPRLAGTPLDQGLVFNISHSNDIALFALGYDRAIGVDVEVWREPRDLEALVDRWFAQEEKAHWHSLHKAQRQACFFRIWTCKESFVKAVGKGISLGLDRCAVEFGSVARYSRVPDECGRPEQWRLEEIPMGVGISAAITIKGPRCEVIVFQMNNFTKSSKNTRL